MRHVLLEWSGWKSDPKKWLQAQSTDIRIVELIDGYARIASTFDTWLHDRIGRKHESEIREYEAAAEAFNREWDRAFGM